jgi:hypothetical protein
LGGAEVAPSEAAEAAALVGEVVAVAAVAA